MRIFHRKESNADRIALAQVERERGEAMDECTSWHRRYTVQSGERQAAEILNRKLTAELEGAEALITTLTQLLCGACQLLENNDIDMSVVKTAGVQDWVGPQDLPVWWKSHKVVDGRG